MFFTTFVSMFHTQGSIMDRPPALQTLPKNSPRGVAMTRMNFVTSKS